MRKLFLIEKTNGFKIAVLSLESIGYTMKPQMNILVKMKQYVQKENFWLDSMNFIFCASFYGFSNVVICFYSFLRLFWAKKLRCLVNTRERSLIYLLLENKSNCWNRNNSEMFSRINVGENDLVAQKRFTFQCIKGSTDFLMKQLTFLLYYLVHLIK